MTPTWVMGEDLIARLLQYSHLPGIAFCKPKWFFGYMYEGIYYLILLRD